MDKTNDSDEDVSNWSGNTPLWTKEYHTSYTALQISN